MSNKITFAQFQVLAYLEKHGCLQDNYSVRTVQSLYRRGFIKPARITWNITRTGTQVIDQIIRRDNPPSFPFEVKIRE